METNYDRRWTHHRFDTDGTEKSSYDEEPPEACLPSAGVRNYDLTRRCITERKDGLHSDKKCHSPDSVNSTNIKSQPIVVEGGDIKLALETAVCCFKNEGRQEYLDNSAVHVRLRRVTSSGNDPQRRCSSSEDLSSNYVVNCTKVRSTICR